MSALPRRDGWQTCALSAAASLIFMNMISAVAAASSPAVLRR